MVEAVRNALLRAFRVPPEPHPPAGAPGSLRVFRAGKNFFKLKVAGWGISQLFAFAGILFWVWVFVDIESAVIDIKDNRARAERKASSPAPTSETAPVVPTLADATAVTPTTAEPPAKSARKASQTPRKKQSPGETFTQWKMRTAQALAQFPGWAFVVVWVLKIFGLLAYFVQLPITYAIARFDYEMRWYLVTDRSLRIRHGIWKLEESTMSFMNIQQVVVSQGPIQRFLGIADVRVQSAGGGGGDHHNKGDDSLHTAVFHAVENADEIRDLILARLRQFRAAGLGDPDDHHTTGDAIPHAATPIISSGAALAAAQELLDEARKLRAAV